MTIREFEINGNKITFVNSSRSTRSGFAHDTTLFINGYQAIENSCHYLNRTWEAYQYQTVMLSAVYDLKQKRIDDIKASYKRINNLTGIRSKKAKHDIEMLMIADDRLTLYDDIMSTLRAY